VGDSFNHLVQVIEQTRQADIGDTVVWDYTSTLETAERKGEIRGEMKATSY